MKIGQLDTSKIIVTDFESYFDDNYHLLRNGKGQRTEEYILDKRWKAHGVAVADHKGRTDWIEERDIPRWIRAHRKHTIVNHKLTFDALVWKLRYNHVAPFMVDTLFLANAVLGPAQVSGGVDLESVAENLGFQPKGKIDMFKGKYNLTPEETQAMRVYATNDADLTFKSFHALLPQLSRPEFELWLIDHTLRILVDKPLPVMAGVCSGAIKKVEQRVAQHVRELPKIVFTHTEKKTRSKKGQKYVEEIKTKRTVDASVLASGPQFAEALVDVLAKAKVKMPMKMGKNNLIPALAKNDEAFIALKDHKNKTLSGLVRARLAKKSGDTQIARLRGLLICASCGGFRPYLVYCGSHTGRWAGGGGLNPQNFPNPSRSTDDFEREVATLIRECIVPGKGKKFVAVDAANIEARVLAWWARQQDLVDAFGTGSDVYSEFATESFGEEVRKPKDGDAKPVIIRLKLLRAAGKEAVLGLGYCMGAPKMETRMRSRPDVVPLFSSGDLDSKKCEQIVQQYRKKYPFIVELWGKVEAAFHAAAGGAQRMVNGVLFECDRSAKGRRSVVVTLPSGRTIHYPNVRMEKHFHKGKERMQWVYGHGRGSKLYGGLLVENIVQAMSRDILAEGVWAMEAAGWEVAYHVHDSIVCVAPTKKAKKCMEFCIDVLSTAPEWGQGMRLGAEGAIEECFS